MQNTGWIHTHMALFITLVVLAAVWSLPWKLVALWRAARNGDIVWFVVLAFINTLAILEIVYLFGVDSGQTRLKVR